MKKKPAVFCLAALLCVLCCACAQQAAEPAAPALSAAEPSDVQSAVQPETDGSPAAPAQSAGIALQAPSLPVETFTRRLALSEQDAIDVFEGQHEFEGYTLKSRSYHRGGAGVVYAFRAEGSGSSVCFPLPFSGSASGCAFTYDGVRRCWTRQLLSDGSYQANVLLLDLEGGGQYLLCLPRSYTRLENGVICHMPSCNGSVQAAQQERHLDLTVTGRLPEGGGFCDFLAVFLPEGGIDPEDPDSCAYALGQYTLDGNSKWLFDGYWRATAYNYIPTGENCYYCCAASYLADCIVERIGKCPAALLLSAAMLDTIARCQNEAGFWPTSAGSQWLQDDYGIGPGFYDTRFNTDLLLTYLDFSEQTGSSCFSDTVSRYIGFYLTFSAKNHTDTENGGWLVADYGCADEHTLPHTSLNHQLAEALLLYRAASFLEDPSLSVLADRLMQAIDDTGSGWIRDDHDLHYCIFPDGSYGLQDYPALTYNDMYNLQAYCRCAGRAEYETLRMLMAEKKLWMDANGITDYKS